MMRVLAVISLLIGLTVGCDKQKGEANQVVLYTAVDEPVARPIISEFERQSGIKVILKTDGEATKTAGLAERLEAEKGQPQADVWWSNEIFHTIHLAEQGVLDAYASPSAEQIPAQFKDNQSRWAGTALRARVIAVSTREPALKGSIQSLRSLLDSKLAGKICMARPNAGTTKGHVAALYTVWGAEAFELFMISLKGNGIRLVGGNSVVAEQVGQGTMLVGLTDNDDVDAMAREGGKLEMVLPDQGADEMGTLMIPCTVGMVKGGPHSANAKKLADYLLSKDVEKKLLEAKFAKYSVFDRSAGAAKAMKVDFVKAAANMRPAVELALEVLERK